MSRLSADNLMNGGWRLLANGCWLLAIGFQLLAFGYRCAFGNPPPRHCVALSPLTSSGAQESI